MISIIISILLLAVLLILLYDFLPAFKNWLGRIKIGSISEDAEWEKATQAVIYKWLSKGAPEVPVDENKRCKLIADIKGTNKASSIAYWQDAAVVKAGGLMGDTCADLVEQYIDADSGEWLEEPKRIDCAMLAYEIVSLPAINPDNIRPAMDYVANLLKSKTGEDGTVFYNDNAKDVRFVDTVGMICPFLIRYACLYDDEDCMELAMRQIKEYRKNGFHDETGIPFHCYNEKTKAPLGICGWGRGCAWWALGLTESLFEMLHCKGHNSEKVILLKYTLEILEKMKNYQRKDGSFGRMIFASSMEDSSAAAMFAYCYLKVYGLTGFKEYKETALKILSHLKTCTRRNGVIDYSQGDTKGIGFYADGLSVVPAAQGFAVAADCIRKKKERKDS